MLLSPEYETDHNVVIEIGGIPIALQTSDAGFVRILESRYGDYLKAISDFSFSFRIELIPPEGFDSDHDAEVWVERGEWRLERGDFRATWNPETQHGVIRQSANPYSIDSVLRIAHTLLLARSGGFLLHASSAVRNGKAFLFAGVSEAGKTTIARLAPPDVALLTDEVSYVRRIDDRYLAYGTPFAGELGEPGKNISAPIAALYLLEKAPQNHIKRVDSMHAAHRLLRNILFFAHDEELVRLVFESALAFVEAVPIYELSFVPDQRVWELIG